MRELLLLGAGGLGREAAEAAQHDYRITGILDDNGALHGAQVAGINVLGGIHLASEHDAQLLVCVGPGVGRRNIVQRLGALGVGADRFATLIDESVRVPESCAVGAGSIILAGAVLTANVTIGRHVVLMPNVTLTHDNRLGDFVTIAAGVALGGGAVLEEACYVGMNASVRQHVRVGHDTVIGMGAVVLEDVPPEETWAGVPARALTRQHTGGPR